jgi:hypothetical protein
MNTWDERYLRVRINRLCTNDCRRDNHKKAASANATTNDGWQWEPTLPSTA